MRGLTRLSSQGTGPASNLPGPPGGNGGITEEERRTIIEMMAERANTGVNLAAADLDDSIARL